MTMGCKGWLCFLGSWPLVVCSRPAPATDLPVWPAPETTLSGDVNKDARLDLSDAISVLQFLFTGGPPPAHLGCGEELSSWQNGDANGDWTLDLSDAVSILSFLFAGGKPPVGACEFPGTAFPPESRPYGLSYAEWSMLWWRWMFCLPATGHPALDPEVACDVGQSGPVLHLPGALGSESGNRLCRIPVGRPVFFPILNTECSTLEALPYACSDAPSCSDCASSFPSPADELECTVDGRPIENLHGYRVESPYFRFRMPAEDNLLSSEATEGFSVADGYYLLIPPLPPGEHLIHASGSFASGPAKGFSVEATVTLIVE